MIYYFVYWEYKKLFPLDIKNDFELERWKELDKFEKIFQEKQFLKQRVMRKILENPEDEDDLQIILNEVKKGVEILEKNRENLQKKLEFLNKQKEWFEAILEVEKQYKNKIEKLTEEQWMDLTHKFMDKIFVEEDNIKVVTRIRKIIY